ncbi:ABC transporter ATP-binding protein [Carboxydochorda subterranea]|uniref:ABC transporter ATP-binding protein n=1 Tax=Carboxydichorda subterranea TaxID=3109565 RepID=A0ABZ1BW54_9FIRM|nr:ABC transporter ATP-binding protein [Limnochorda sp. L945t]WRP17021.1 ABC transporter ATP-binding protein [Limnochorda sp. L945t]
MSDVVLQLRGIVKRFPGVVANDHVDLELRQGEILALLGENGAGKTTLMNVLYGLLSPDEGEIRVAGRRVRFDSPSDAMRAGIGMVHQHFMLVPVMTVAENVVLGAEPVRGRFFVDAREAARRVADISTRYGLQVEPGALVRDLPVGVQQRVEIIKLLYRSARVLILDEPTAVLTPQEVDELFAILEGLARAGHSVIFITHKLKEALAIADRIVVLRQGRVVGATTPDRSDEAQLAAMMVGRAVSLELDKPPARPGAEVLAVRNLWVVDDRHVATVRGVSFEVRAGEILGIAGVQGNGQTELMEALARLRPVAAGEIRVLGRSTAGLSVRDLWEMGVAYVPEDRQRDGLILPFPIYENLALNNYHRPPASSRGMLHMDVLRRRAEELVRTFDIRTPSVDMPVSALSGGNQQKVIMAREFSRPIRLLLASQPTRGLDVASVEYIHRRILDQREAGAGVVLVSTELEEILGLSDRIAVMYRGQVVALEDRARMDRHRLGLLMAGAAA